MLYMVRVIHCQCIHRSRVTPYNAIPCMSHSSPPLLDNIIYSASTLKGRQECGLHTMHTWEVSPIKEAPDSKFNFSSHMNTMELLFLGGLHKMCMFHEPEGFWPTIFSGYSKSHCPCSLHFTATSRKHFDRQNPPFSWKSLPKSEAPAG